LNPEITGETQIEGVITMHRSAQREERRGVTLPRRRRSAPAYVAIGLRPDAVSLFAEELEEEGAMLLRVQHDDEGSALVFFQLAAGDPGGWLPTLPRRWGCGLAPAPRR
jgi:hypothetical protein